MRTAAVTYKRVRTAERAGAEETQAGRRTSERDSEHLNKRREDQGSEVEGGGNQTQQREQED